jgi:L-ascorbate metabolism protein UlaG (beta-lactamase superfamily)
VGGVAIEYEGDLLLTAPLFTNPGLLAVTTGETISDTALIDALLPIEHVAGAAAILVGHGHYDHLLDVPYVQELAGDPVVYGNRSVRNLVGASLGGRMVVLNDPDAPWVDRRMCPDPDPCTGVPAEVTGDWVHVPGTRARIRALCSSHPAQFLGVVHFGKGCVDSPMPSPPVAAGEWLEGATLAYLIDFLGPDGEPVWRVYYQDAPTDGPAGHVHPDLLQEKAVDVALVNVGNWDAVEDHPGRLLANLEPRYVLGLHWETFFDTQIEPIVPIPFHADPQDFDARARAALPGDDEPVVLVDGHPMEGRYWRPWPGTLFEFDSEAPPAFEFDAWTEPHGDAVALRTTLPADVDDCLALSDPNAPCGDADADGLVDAWEDLVLDLLRPTIRFDEAEPMFLDLGSVLHDVGRVAPVGDHIRVFVMMGYSSDYGRCGATAHNGDSERVVLDLERLDGPGDVAVVGTYTAAHEGTVTDHGRLLQGNDLSAATFESARWVVFASDGKHATYSTIPDCEDAEWAPCLDEDCAPDAGADPDAFDVLPPVINAGEADSPRWTDLAAIGFRGEDPWLDQPFCGGRGRGGSCSSSIRSKLLDDPFE